MLIRKCSHHTIQWAASAAGVRADIDKRESAWKVKLYAQGPRYRRRSQSRCANIEALCWHGFKAFFDELYRREARASVRTAFVHYKDAGDFEAKYQETGYRNIGSQMYPLEAQDACDCAILAQPMVCDVCSTGEGVTYKRHGWERVTRVCKSRHCRRAVEAVERLRSH